MTLEMHFKLLVLKKMTFFVHSDLTKFGNLLMFNRNQLLETLIREFKHVGDKTLIIPTFSYGFSKNQIFDVKNTKSTTGTRKFQKAPVLKERFNPYNHAVWGYRKKILLILVKIHLVKILFMKTC